MNQGNIEEAIQNYKKAIKINPEFTAAYCNLAKIFY
jgi:cytochrome c-type biogenesis protein CcmH/NrfG